MTDYTENITCEICNQVFAISKWGDGKCSTCGMAYEYNEGYMVALSDSDVALLRLARGVGGGRKVEGRVT